MRKAQSRRGEVFVARIWRKSEENRERWYYFWIGERFEELKRTNTFLRFMFCRRMLEACASDPRTGEHIHCIYVLYLSVSKAVVTSAEKSEGHRPFSGRESQLKRYLCTLF